jgi:hypothetical protein
MISSGILEQSLQCLTNKGLQAITNIFTVIIQKGRLNISLLLNPDIPDSIPSGGTIYSD